MTRRAPRSCAAGDNRRIVSLGGPQAHHGPECDDEDRAHVHHAVCPYCIRAKALLKQRGVAQIDEIRVDLDPSQRMHMMQITGRRTVPQIFIGDTHVGGCDDLMALDQRGGLMPAARGIVTPGSRRAARR